MVLQSVGVILENLVRYRHGYQTQVLPKQSCKQPALQKMQRRNSIVLNSLSEQFGVIS